MDASDSDSDLERNRRSMFDAVSIKKRKGKEISEDERCSDVQSYLDEGVDINAKDEEGNTILHIAVKKGFEKVVEFLLEKRARANIKNDQGDTAVTLARRLGEQKIARILEDSIVSPCEPVPGCSSRKHPADAELGVSSTKRTRPGSAGETRKEEGWAMKGEYPAKGLKTSQHGDWYQVQHLVLHLYRASKLPGQPRFRLSTEMKTAGKLNDVVLEYEDSEGRRSHRFVQLKHSQDEKQQITMKELLAANGKSFSLPEYLISWRRIKKHPDFSGSESKIFILCTNRGLDRKKSHEEHIHVTSLQDPDEFLGVTNGSRYKLQVKRLDSKLCNGLKSASDIRKLATELANCVSGASAQRKKAPSIKLSNDVFEYYQIPLTQEIIDVDSKKFSDKFIRNDDKSSTLSDEAKILRKVFFEQVKKFSENKPLSEKQIWDNLKMKKLEITKGYIESAKSNIAKLKLASDLNRLAKELAEFVYNPSSQDLDLKNDIFEKYRALIAQEVLNIGIEKEPKFHQKFINNNIERDPLSNEANHLRRMFLEHAKKNPENHTLSDQQIRNNLKEKKFSVSEEFVKSADEKLYSDICDFAEKLFNCVCGPPDGQNLTHDILYYQTPLVNEVFDLQKKEFSDKFITNHPKSGQLSNQAAKLREIFLEEAKKLPNNKGVADEDIWNVLKHKKLKMSEEFVASARLTRTQLTEAVKLPNDDFVGDDEALLNDINTFFDQFILAVKQPNEVELGTMIEAEFSQHFNFVNVGAIKSLFDTAIMNWFKKKEGEFLVREDAEKLFNDVYREIACLMTAGLRTYSEELKAYEVNFKSQVEDLSNFLNSSEMIGNQIWQFISSGQTLLTTSRIYQTFRSMKNFTENDSYIFLKAKLLKSADIEEQVFMALELPSSYNLLVLDFGLDSRKQDRHELFNKIREHTTKLSERKITGKRIILIIPKMDVEDVKLEIADRTIIEEERDVSIDKLETFTQQEILEKKLIKFQGREQQTSFTRLLGKADFDNIAEEKLEDFIRIINQERLVKLIRDEEIRMGGEVKGLGEVADYYIPRTIDRFVVIKADIFIGPKISDIFAVAGVDGETMEELLANESERKKYTSHGQRSRMNEYIILKNGQETDHFECLCNENLNHNIHWLDARSGKLIWIRSSGSITNLVDFKDGSKDVDIDAENGRTVLNEDQLVEHTQKHRIVILSDTAGKGKSTVLTRLAQRIKEKEPSLLVISIDLTASKRVLYVEETARTFDSNDIDGAVDFLVDKLGPKLEYEDILLFKFIIKVQQRATLLFDGFDEISPDYKKIVIDLLLSLAKLKVKLFITTRPHMCQALENKLGIFSYTLQLFSPEDQKEFLMNFWSRKLPAKNTVEDINVRLKEHAEKVLELFANSIDCSLMELTGIPLQTRMMAEVFPFNESVSLDTMDIIVLYRAFVNTKYDIFYREKKDGHFPNRSERFSEKHQQLALDVLFAADTVSELLQTQSIKDASDKHLRKIFEDVQPIGIVTSYSDGTPDFIHRTFAEYFAATFLVKTMNDHSQNEQVREFFVTQFFVKPEYQMTRAFVNCLLKNGKYTSGNQDWNFDLSDYGSEVGMTLYHVAAEERHSEILIFFLNTLKERSSNPFSNINCRSTLGVTALHISSDAGDLGSVKSLLEKRANIEAADNNGRTPLCIAAYSGQVDVVKHLLEKRANIEAADNNGRTPLCIAAYSGKVDVVNHLLRKRANIEAADNNGWTPLGLAALRGDVDVVKHLLEKRANIEAADNNGRTPLCIAAYSGKVDVVNHLLGKRANIEAVDKDGLTPLSLATLQGNVDVVQLLLAKIHS